LLFPKHLPGEIPTFMDLFTPPDGKYWDGKNNEKLFKSFIKMNKKMNR